MKSRIIFITLMVSLACQFLGQQPVDSNVSSTQTQVSTETQEIVSQPTATTIPINVPAAENLHTDFILILMPDAYNITLNEDGSVTFLTNAPINGVEYFYQTAYPDRGLNRLIGPSVPKPAEGCLNMLFDGDPSGKPIVVSGCTIQTGELSVTIGLEGSNPPDTSAESEETHLDFLLTNDAYNIIDNEDGSITFFSNMSFEDVEGFYRQELPLRGYTERIFDAPRPAEGCFMMIFDVDPSGRAMVVSGCIIFQTGEISVSIKLDNI